MGKETVKRTVQDPEITAIKAVDRAMEKLPDEPTRERVLSYIDHKYISPKPVLNTVNAPGFSPGR